MGGDSEVLEEEKGRGEEVLEELLVDEGRVGGVTGQGILTTLADGL